MLPPLVPGRALYPDWLDAQRDSPTRSEAEGHALRRLYSVPSSGTHVMLSLVRAAM